MGGAAFLTDYGLPLLHGYPWYLLTMTKEVSVKCLQCQRLWQLLSFPPGAINTSSALLRCADQLHTHDISLDAHKLHHDRHLVHQV